MSYASAGACLPVIRGLRADLPFRQRHQKIRRQRMDIRLVHVPQGPESLLRFATALKQDAVRCQVILQPDELAWRESIFVRVMRTRIEYMRNVDHGMPGNRECELCLVCRHS